MATEGWEGWAWKADREEDLREEKYQRTHFPPRALICHSQQSPHAVNWPLRRTQAPHRGWTGREVAGGRALSRKPARGLWPGVAPGPCVTICESLPVSVKQGPRPDQWFSTTGRFVHCP